MGSIAGIREKSIEPHRAMLAKAGLGERCRGRGAAEMGSSFKINARRIKSTFR